MYKVLGLVFLASASLSVVATPASALQATVTQVDSNSDGSKTYHFAVTVDQGETLTPGAGTSGDFVTVYNFYGLVEGSVKSPDGWLFSSEEFGRTPTMSGYPLVLPVDVPNTPNLTWTTTKPMIAGKAIEGFTAVTKSSTMTDGEYSAMVTRQVAATKGAPADMPTPATVKQAVIGFLPMPGFLAQMK